MKGIVLAGGTGSRLRPITNAISKHLLLVYSKPMIYYPISTLMLAGIKDILIIGTENDLPLYKRLLGDGTKFGCEFSYAEQNDANGIACAFNIGRSFVGTDRVALILGDNLFYGEGLIGKLNNAKEGSNACLFGYQVADPRNYGIAVIKSNGQISKIIEKPIDHVGNTAITGLYFYPNDVLDRVEDIKPSSRGELEITDLNNLFIDDDKVEIIQFGRGFNWYDLGRVETLKAAANSIETIENRTSQLIGCLEEIAVNNNWKTKDEILQTAKLGSSFYDLKLKDFLLRED